MKRRLIASGFIFVDCCRELLANEGSIFIGKMSRTGAVEDCKNDDQINGIGKCWLRVLSAFGNVSESVGSRDDDSGSGSLINIKFELDFYC